MTTLNYLVNSSTGLGHCSRLIAILEALATLGDNFQVRVFRHPAAAWYLDALASTMPHVQTYPLSYRSNYDDNAFNPEAVYAQERAEQFFDDNAAIERQLLDADLYLTDWLGQVVFIRERRRGDASQPFIAGIYHSDVWPQDHDSIGVRNWKRSSAHIVESALDLFFHVAPSIPSQPYPWTVPSLPVPIVARQVNERYPLSQYLARGIPYGVVNMGYAEISASYQGKSYVDHVIRHMPFDTVIVLSGEAQAREENREGKRVIWLEKRINGHEVVAASSLVVTKPGMSIISECIAGSVPIAILPPDRSERVLKVELLQEILGAAPPIIGGFDDAALEEGMASAQQRAPAVQQTFASVPTVGAQVIAMCLIELTRSKLKLNPRSFQAMLDLSIRHYERSSSLLPS